MYFRGIVALVFIVLFVLGAGCSFPGTTPNPATSRGSAGSHMVIETPTLPEQYTAKAPRSESYTPIRYSSSVAMATQRPVLESAAHTEINGTGLKPDEYEDALINATLAVISKSNWQAERSKIVLTAVDSNNTITREFAFKWTRATTLFENICNMFDPVMDWDILSQFRYGVQDNWTYMTDQELYGKPEYWAAASETITNVDPVTKKLRGDCDDFAILNAAMTRAIGGHSRLAYALSPSSNGTFCVGHLYMEAFSADPSFNETIRTRYKVSEVTGFHQESYGFWVAMDWFPDKSGYQHPGASLYDSSRGLTFFYPDGTWVDITPVHPSCYANSSVRNP